MVAWFRNLFARSAPSRAAGQAHLTFGATSVGRTLSRTGQILARQLWIWPIIAVVLLAIVGYGIKTSIERTMQANVRSQLQTLLDVERSMLETWVRVQETNAQSLANDPQVRETVAALVAPMEQGAPSSLSTLSTKVGHELSPGMAAHGFVTYVVVDKEQRILAATNPEMRDQTLPYERFLNRALEGEVAVSPPFASVLMMKDERGRMRTGVPTMFVCAPIRDQNLQVVAALGLRIRPEREFTRILQLGQMGTTGETYAIDRNGLMVSNSRFDDSLISLGILPDVEDTRSLLTVSVRDPGGNLADGFRPKKRRAELPLTKAAASATEGNAGIDIEGYSDYRGVPVVGAWQWLPKYEIGLITEVDYAEAYRPLSILRWAFYSIFGLLVLSSVAIFAFTVIVARLNRSAQKAAIEAKNLGQYRLEERLGAGAMGVVYKGHHAMLRRPTAIKLLNVDKVNDASIERFEREVQITCKLNHPNTVAIYDFGRTPEGVFYYAMEFLDGIDLQQLVDRYGPQSETRTIHILKQICGSLYEAHSLGLVHRDIKPANVMLNRRGSEPDVVKVLDFGLVRALDEGRQTRESGGLVGTPLYMSPEAIQSPDTVDARSDLYAVGAVGYFLMTGKPVFEAPTLVELCQKHVIAIPTAPSERSGKSISSELEAALLACLEKDRSRRPQTAREFVSLLDRSPLANSWSLEEAEAWWGRHARHQATVATTETLADDRPAEDAGRAATNGGTRAGGFEQTIATERG